MSEEELEHLITLYQQWDRERLLTFILVHACARLGMLRASEEQRRIPQQATLEQQKFLLLLARELKASAPTPAKGKAGSTQVEEDEISESVRKAKLAFSDLDVNDRMLVRDATQELFRNIDLFAERVAKRGDSNEGNEQNPHAAPEVDNDGQQ